MSQNHSRPGESNGPTPDKTVQAVLFDRDGVLTYFDLDEAIAFFRPLLPISLLEIAARWQAFGDLNGFPRNLAEEKLFFANFWEQLADEFRLTQGQRTVLGRLDYTLHRALS